MPNDGPNKTAKASPGERLSLHQAGIALVFLFQGWVFGGLLLAVLSAHAGGLSGRSFATVKAILERPSLLERGLGFAGLSLLLIAWLGSVPRARWPRLQMITALLGLGLSGALFASKEGHLAAILGITLLITGPLAAGLACLAQVPVKLPKLLGFWRKTALIWLFVLPFGLHFGLPLHRHLRFGSGSWDLGATTHNLYLTSQGLPTLSSVLGDVNFLGDHFSPILYAFAPLVWLHSGAETALLIQAFSVAAIGPAIFLIARHRGASKGASWILGISASLSYFAQSAAYFDAHPIIIGIGLLAFALYAIETERYRLASLLLLAYATAKESVGAYIIGLGLFLLYQGVKQGFHKRKLRYGVAWVLLGSLIFVLVNRWVLPTLIATGNLPEPHETFEQFGNGVFQALIGMIQSPSLVLAEFFDADAKRMSWLVTLGGGGFLALARPQILIAALPLLAERFLSTKASMWGLGFHYGLPLSLYSFWAVASAWPWLERKFGRLQRAWMKPERRDPRTGRARKPGLVLASYVLVSGLLMNGFGGPRSADYFIWNKSYFSSPKGTELNRAMLQRLEGLGKEARLALQNHLLPHMADRRYAYRIGDWSKADWVVLSLDENAWPYARRFPRELSAKLSGLSDWTRVHAVEGREIWMREGALQKLPKGRGLWP